MLVLGVDPGLTRCGLGLVEGSLGRSLRARHVEVLGTPTSMPLPDRLLTISSRVRDLIDASPPDVVAVERIFSQQNRHTVMGTAQAAAAAVLAAAEAGVPVAWHTPTEVKAAVTGSGRADKAQVAGMVVRLLQLKVAPRPVDATDALALAICHVWRGAAAARLEAAAAGVPRATLPRPRDLRAGAAAAGRAPRRATGTPRADRAGSTTGGSGAGQRGAR